MNRQTIFAALLLVLVWSAAPGQAQTTSFTYQGRLTTNNTPATGAFDFEFRLFDTLSGGIQQGSAQTLTNVAVDKGVFSVQLDFGACASCFNGAPRFLEIAVKPTSGGTFTPLAPRQPLTSTPYAIKTQNLTFNGAFNDGLMPPTVFTATNTFAGEDAGLNTTPSINLGNAAGRFNSFFGAGAGKANINGFFNAFFGSQAGQANTSGNNNAFFGHQAGQNNTLGNGNALFGIRTGQNNTLGNSNAFFGDFAGLSNITGSDNTGIGVGADVGADNLTNATAIGSRALAGCSNCLVLGSISGVNFAAADTNVGIGTTAPEQKLHVVGNEILSTGSGAGFKFRDRGSSSPTDDWVWYSSGNVARFFHLGIGDIISVSPAGNVGIGTTTPGYKLAILDPSNTGLRVQTSTVGGTVASFGDSGDFRIDSTSVAGGRFIVKESGNVGIGTTAPTFKLQVIDPANTGLRVQTIASGGTVASFGGVGDFQIDAPFNTGGRFIIKENGNTGIGTAFPFDRLEVNGIARINILGAAGSTALCRNGSNQISSCSSSIRYKNNIAALHTGLSLINRLRPVTFDWKQNGEHDLGLVAEEVAKVEPLLVTHNDKGEIEGVKYDRVAVVLLNAVKEQQAQIKEQAAQLQLQHQEIAVLKKMLCRHQPKAAICKAAARHLAITGK
jgi:hypothetical protein